MGKIYAFSEIANRRVPHPNDFLRAKGLVLDNLSRIVKEGSIHGAKVFGSVAKGTPNERSDFDILVITENDTSFALLKEVFDEVKNQTNVEVEPLVVARKFAEKGFHTVDDSILEHIRSIPNDANIAGLNPLDIIEPLNLSAIRIHEQYLVQKLRRLREGVFTYSEVDRLRVLQRALEEPVNLGRRMLQILPHLGYPLEMEDDDKKTVIKHFQETFGKTPLVNGFDVLLQHDKNYTLYLIEALEEGMTQRDYETRVDALAQECIPQAIAWTSDMSRVYLRLFEGNRIDREAIITLRRGKETLG